MFELRNDEVWYNSGNMVEWIMWGKQIIKSLVSEDESEQKYEVKKFNLEAGSYEHTNEFSEITYQGQTYEVKDGYFIVPKEIEPEPEPTPAQPTNQDIMDKLDEMSAGQISKADLDAAYAEGVNDVG